MILSLLILWLLQFLQVHVQCLSIRLYLLDPLNYFLFEYLLALFHLMDLFLTWFSFGGGWSRTRRHSCIGLSRWLLQGLPWGVHVASEGIIIGQLLICLGYLLSLVVVKPLCAITIELGLVLITLDHLFQMLFHGKLTRTARKRLNLFFVLLTNHNRIIILLILHLLLSSHLLRLIESIGWILLLVLEGHLLLIFGGTKRLVLVESEVEFESLELFGCSTGRRATRLLLLLLCLNSRATCRPIWIYDVWYSHRSWREVLLHSLLLQIIGAFIQSETLLVISAPAQTWMIKCRAASGRYPGHARYWGLMMSS